MKARTESQFTRILGRAPRLRSIRAQFTEPAMLETFGPGERIERPKSTLLFWNFVSEDGKNGFTLFARIRPVTKTDKFTVNLTADHGVQSFYMWVLDRLSAADNGDAAPLFIGSGAFAITRVGR